ncbi:ankyrin repeat-containing protein ITN1-like [Gastrolobium bilobum]|uniref:ankyrin repeat-containing protein ITN1-like n=1 Tax=Gastrolobium bilobum TaxID=150636 RepID=UPI002AB25BB7|nr:ankyrin repeat-containing protein ITN1-like [Gastrolobium bilobum]
MDKIVVNVNGSEPNTPRRPTLVLSSSGNPLLVSNSSSGKSLSSSKSNNVGKKKYVRQVTGRHNDTDLHLAAQRGDAVAVRKILNMIDAQMVGTLSSADFDAEVAEIRSAIVNDVNELAETALFVASDKGHLDVVKELLKYASPEGVSLKNDLGFDPLHIAASRGNQAIVQLLLDHDPGLIKTFSQSNATPLISAATRGHTSIVDLLLSYDPSQLELSKSNGKNALHLSGRQGHVDVVRILLMKDPQLARRTDKKGQTALHMAVKGVSLEVVKLILDADAAIVMLPDKFGNTALHIATRKKRVEIVNELLLLPETNVNVLTRDQKTALDIAEALPPSEEILDIKDSLVRYGAVKANDLNQPRDELRNTVTQIRKDVRTQLEQTRKTNKNVNGIAMELRELHRAGINNATNSVTVVAVLFATVAFASIFSVPGGDDDNGVAVMVGTLAFDIFFISNAIALFTSLAVVVVQITLVRGRTKSEMRVTKVINKMMWLASICTTIAFTSASYIVVGPHHKWAAMFVTILGGVMMVSVLGTMTYYVLKSKRYQRARKKENNLMSGLNSGSETEIEANPIYAI